MLILYSVDINEHMRKGDTCETVLHITDTEAALR